jgi:NAD(P)-dependent dehydrogenase (short-subunit alcohol dehydrogenase family)
LLLTARRRRRAIDFDGRVALITGGSRGLGLLIARELGRHGAQVTIVARDVDELRRAQDQLERHGVHAQISVADLAVPSDARRIVQDVVTRHGRIDVLVNNAGVIKVGPFDHMAVDDFEEAMAVHFWGPLHTMQAAIPHMRGSRDGRIVNISSIGGKIGVPHLVPYCASKFALTGLSTALRAELAREGILVTTVSPGLMRTGSPFNAWFKGRHREEFAWFAIADSLPVLSIDARRAAARIVDAAKHGDPELVITWPARFAVLAAALLSRPTAAALSVANQLLPSPARYDGEKSHRGWESVSTWSPSWLTRLSDTAAVRNNELPSSMLAQTRE